jgi:integrase
VSFVGEKYAGIYEMSQVQPAMARAFFKSEEDRGVSAKTYNNTLIFLRSSFEALKEDGGIPKNPFGGIPTKEEQTIFRKPFTADELALIAMAAKADPFIEPIIITGICTAMRRGDCCLLPKSAIDLPNRFMKVKSSKTGELVQIPIFPLLYDVLSKRPQSDSPFVFPVQAAKYQLNPDHITLRVRKVMKAAGFFDPDDSKDETGQQDQDSEKDTHRGEIHQARPNGLRLASVRDFHSFRVTWVTLALTAGVPLEIVQKVTGHRTASIVMKHYFQPGREEFRRTLAGKLPALIGGPISIKPIELSEIRSMVEAMKPTTWKKVREELLSRLPTSGITPAPL